MPLTDWMKKELNRFCPDVDTSLDYPPEAIGPLMKRLGRKRSQYALESRRELVQSKGIKPGVRVTLPYYGEVTTTVVSISRDWRVTLRGINGLFHPAGVNVCQDQK